MKLEEEQDSVAPRGVAAAAAYVRRIGSAPATFIRRSLTAPAVKSRAGAASSSGSSSEEDGGDSEAATTDDDEARLSAAATSLRNSYKPPKLWMLAVGAVLAACAGMTNVIALFQVGHFVSHMTGTVSRLAISAREAAFQQPHTIHVQCSLLSSFIFGAFLCGLIIDKNQVHFGGKSFYGAALVGNALLLAAASALAEFDKSHLDIVAGSLAACACGLQNAMCTSHFGAVVRTTHVSGTFTDIGSTAGRVAAILLWKRCRLGDLSEMDRAEIYIDSTKLKILLLLAAGFFIGCLLGAFINTGLGHFGFLVPAFITGSFGVVYLFFRSQLKETVKTYEEAQLTSEVREVEGVLSRTAALLRAMHRLRSDGQVGLHLQDSDVTELEARMEHCLEVMRDVSATLDGYNEWRSFHRLERCHTAPASVLDRTETRPSDQA